MCDKSICLSVVSWVVLELACFMLTRMAVLPKHIFFYSNSFLPLYKYLIDTKWNWNGHNIYKRFHRIMYAACVWIFCIVHSENANRNVFCRRGIKMLNFLVWTSHMRSKHCMPLLIFDERFCATAIHFFVFRRQTHEYERCLAIIYACHRPILRKINCIQYSREHLLIGQRMRVLIDLHFFCDKIPIFFSSSVRTGTN